MQLQWKPAQSSPSKWFALGLASVVLLGGSTVARAQWQMQFSGTHANLRAIHAVNANIAWAGGDHGVILRTVDGGRSWQSCQIPPRASQLDFRSLWAWDADHAMAMSSGPGAASRLYSTHDGCHTWHLVFTNPDANGFWDSLQFDGTRFGVVLGDPVRGRFTLFVTYDGGSRWTRQLDSCLRTTAPNQGAFAASNQSLAVLPIPNPEARSGSAVNHQIWFGASGGWLYSFELAPLKFVAFATPGDAENSCTHVRALPSSAAASNTTSGIFAVAFQDLQHGIVVGGDYAHPQVAAATAAYTLNGQHWLLSPHSPGGYRSAVAWNATDSSWIAAGPTGSDISWDGGKNWQPLDHAAWNSLSLPFAAGPDGRIARLISWGQLRASNRTPAAAQPASPGE